jgi:hypothetical protein
MANVLRFPVLESHATCGKVLGHLVPMHVWGPNSKVGDHCRCGQRTLPATAVIVSDVDADDTPIRRAIG